MKKKYIIIILIEIAILVGLVIVDRNVTEEEVPNEADQNETQDLESIFYELPYEGETFSIYYYQRSNTFEVQVKEPPIEENLENAIFFMNKYKETENFTKDDVRIVTPSLYTTD